jgi:hypothetical protein
MKNKKDIEDLQGLCAELKEAIAGAGKGASM